jgi:hypothetical protein
MTTPYRYRMANVVWRRWIGPGHIGIVHGEAILLQRNEDRVGFSWHARHRRTGEEWRGSTILGLVQQIWCDLHAEKFDVDVAHPADGDYQQCADCRQEVR